MAYDWVGNGVMHPVQEHKITGPGDQGVRQKIKGARLGMPTLTSRK